MRYPSFPFLSALALGSALFFMGSLFVYAFFGDSVHGNQPVNAQIREGETARVIAQRWGREKVLRHGGLFLLLAVLQGAGGHLQAGEYHLSGNETPQQLLNLLTRGASMQVSLTIPEGLSIRDIASELNRTKLAEGKRFQELAHDPTFIASLNLPFSQPLKSLEGLLFPDTYFLHRGIKAQTLIQKMVETYLLKAHPTLARHATKVGLSPYQALILASVVEKETGLASERPIIAAVFHNRLKRGMRLDSDPTVIYGIPDFDGNITYKHLRTKTPYNTYQRGGLPPTPIANPGFESIKAVMNPAEKVNFLYFVATGDGGHHFSTNLRAHNKAVKKYQH